MVPPVELVLVMVLFGHVITDDVVCITEKYGDTEKSQTNYRLKLQPEYVLKKSWFMQIPKLPYCSMSGAMLRVCDPSGQRPLLVNFDSSGAIVVRKADDLTLPAVSNLAVFCRFED